MSDSQFDATTFLDATTTEANERRPPIPAGKILTGIIGEPNIRQTEGKKEKTLGQTFTWLDLPIVFDLNQDPEVRSVVGQDQVTLRFSTGLETTANGALDNSKGKNNGLRVLRDALGMNVPGQPFSIRMMQGKPVRCKIGSRPYQGEVYDEIDSLVKP